MPAAKLGFLLLAGGMLLVAGCGRWSKPGAGRPEFARDRYQCLQESTVEQVRREEFGYPRHVQTIDRRLFRACMNAKGWELG